MMMHRTSGRGETKVDKKGPSKFKSPQPSYKAWAAGEVPGQWAGWQPSKARSRTNGFSPDARTCCALPLRERGTHKEKDKATMSQL